MQICGGLILLLYYHMAYKRSRLNKSIEEADQNNTTEYKEPPNIVISLPTENLQPGENESLCEVATVA